MKITLRKDVVTLTGPILVEQIFISMLGVVNTIMSARIGKEALSAIGMIDSLNSVIQAFFVALSIGSTVVVAQYTGRGDKTMADHACVQSLVSGLLLALAISLSIWLFQAPLLDALFGSAEPLVTQHMNTYLSITLLTYPLIGLTSIACGALRGAGDTSTPMKVNTLMNVLNVFLSYVCIYGLNLGVVQIPGFGVAGAATGLGLARLIGLIYLFSIMLSKYSVINLASLRQFKFNIPLQRSIFAIGIPSSMENMMFTGGKLITQIMIVGMGTTAIAANYIGFSVVNIMNIPGMALSLAATTLVGQFMGRGDSQGAEETLKYIIKLSTICLVTMGLICYPLMRLLVGMYSNDPAVVDLATTLLHWNCLLMVFYSTTFVLPAAPKGAGDAKYAVFTTLIGMWVFRIVLGYFIGIYLGFGLLGVWFGMFIDWAVRSSLYLLRVRSGRWKHHRVIT